MRWLVLLALSCSGQLEYEVSAYRRTNPGTPPAEMTPPRPVVPPAENPPATVTPPPAMMPPPVTTTPPPAMTPPPATTTPPPAPATPPVMTPPAPMTPPAASACANGMDALAIFTTRCGDCHDPQNKAKGLDLVSPGLGARVVGIKSTCNDKLLLDTAGASAAGHLLDKLRGPVAGCGAQMPYGMKALTLEELACVVEWSEKAIARVRSGS